ncbi:hypothetical protein N7456_001553 [Penicillium angulare]|uniref:Uncharacterized protein n=1 Tax=Penicillium angulare TaxID=116970 RepID=A0A9W9G6E2_9EURO|nr:hypothetical protein N7456_001553 [Penicillium angulare]
MHGFQTTWVMLFGIVITVAATSTDGSPALLNFRPFNVTLSSLYFWVGSYFNGTAHFEFSPYAGLAASETAGCPVLRNKTITKDYKALLALTEPAIYNTANDPVNAFLTLWALGFDFGTIPESYITFDMLDSLEYAVYSSDPNFANDTTIIPNNFNWTLEKTQAPPYNLNSVLTDYQGTYPEQDGADDSIQVNSTIANCSGTEVSSWQFTPLSYNSTYNGTNFTDPVISIQFDGQTANLSMKGYASAVSEYKTGSAYQVGSVTFAGEFTLTFSGVIDLYHSDVLRNDMATPTWLRTVGYQNNSLNVGYTSGCGCLSVD